MTPSRSPHERTTGPEAPDDRCRDLHARALHINGRTIGPGSPVYLIAEMSANHGQNFDEAVKIVHAAADAGADAIKLQTYTADTLTLDAPQEYFRVGGGTLWDGRTLHDLYAEAFTPWEWQPRLKEVAAGRGLDLFASAFDPTAVDFLEAMNVPVHKVASFELVDLPLIEKMARTGKPLILSTGMASEAAIAEAVAAARQAGAGQFVLLKCTSAYPSPPEEMHLRTIPTWPSASAWPWACPTTRRASRCRWPPSPSARVSSRSTSPCRAPRAGRTAPSRWSRTSSGPWWKRSARRRRPGARCGWATASTRRRGTTLPTRSSASPPTARCTTPR
jgi:hypothetical protein